MIQLSYSMVRRIVIIPLLFVAFFVRAQELSQVLFSNGSTLSGFSFITDQKIIIRISDNGQLVESGTDPGTGRYNYYTGKLQPYLGRIDYYSQTEYDSVLRGKVKSIGTCNFRYYGASDTKSKSGKLKSVGNTQLDYFESFENKSNAGKLKSAGYIALDYYDVNENEGFRNKLKSVGSTSITYYSSFDDKAISGKIKSIGSFNYDWYRSYDRREYQGAMKFGSVTQTVNGITFLLR